MTYIGADGWPFRPLSTADSRVGNGPSNTHTDAQLTYKGEIQEYPTPEIVAKVGEVACRPDEADIQPQRSEEAA